MKATRPRREVIEAIARAGYEKRYPKGRPTAAPPANGRPALALLGSASYHVVPYDGRGYVLGYVSFEDGIRLMEAKASVDALQDSDPTPEAVSAYRDAMRVIVGMAPRYLLPIERVRRFFWRLGLLRNPWRTATDAEVGQLLGFFLACRMRSRGLVSMASETSPVALT